VCLGSTEKHLKKTRCASEALEELELESERSVHTWKVVAPVGGQVVCAEPGSVGMTTKIHAGPPPAACHLLRVGVVRSWHQRVVQLGSPRGIDGRDVDPVGIHCLVGGAGGGEGVGLDVLGGSVDDQEKDDQLIRHLAQNLAPHGSVDEGLVASVRLFLQQLWGGCLSSQCCSGGQACSVSGRSVWVASERSFNNIPVQSLKL
jgi:hypothetical protein